MVCLAFVGGSGCSVPKGCASPGMQGSLMEFLSWLRFQDEVEVGGAAVGHVGLTPRLDGERDADQGVEDAHQVERVVGELVERELVEVRDCGFGARERSVVER